tara:strand:+ start:98453 stop:99502 length:1050 start_codon:yes stop_codon:yes gene_type:complete
MDAQLSVSSKPRVDWVDAVKGLTIILVVMKHTTYGTEAALHHVPYVFNLLCEWTIPFRMPLFFLVAGLFARKALFAPLPAFLDSKILHFAYFYLLWSFIQIGIKIVVPHEAIWHVSYMDILMIPLEPFGLLWFVYALAIFFTLMRLARNVPPVIMVALALGLYFTRLNTGWTLPDEFAGRFIFFVCGTYAAPYIFAMASWAEDKQWQSMAIGSGLLALVAGMVYLGIVDWRIAELFAGAIGAAGTIMLVALLAANGYARPLTFVGSRSLYVFLAFFLPMAAARILLVKFGVTNGDLITLISLFTAVTGPLVAYEISKQVAVLRFFFERPTAFRLSNKDMASRETIAATP